MYVIPKPGLKVADPARRTGARELYFLPEEGRDVGDENAIYWHRIVRDGDATVGTPPAAAASTEDDHA